MEKDRQTKIIAIVALFIGVVTLTIGFAVYSAKLKIQSKATVTPDGNALKVVLSKEQNSVVVGKITPTGDGDEAIISNIGVPIISSLNANFVNPGEKVVYEFYAMNVGEMDAYLNKVEYANVTGKESNKVCIANEGTTDATVQRACESIRVTIKVGEEDIACQTSTYGGHKLEKTLSEKLVVTIEYEQSGDVADGPFSVEFGDIILNYSLNDTETKNIATCDNYIASPIYHFDIKGRTNVVDNDNDGKISLSDKVTLGTESFYVMDTDETTGVVTMLSEWNLNVGSKLASGDPGIQNSTCKGFIDGQSESNWKCTIAFSSTNYWSSTTSKYPAWVYDSNDIVRNHVNAYVDKLKSAGYSSVEGRLIKREELVALGCDASSKSCNSAPSWVNNTSFWTGTAGDSSYIWGNGTNGYFDKYATYSDGSIGGVRPVITINVSEI